MDEFQEVRKPFGCKFCEARFDTENLRFWHNVWKHEAWVTVGFIVEEKETSGNDSSA